MPYDIYVLDENQLTVTDAQSNVTANQLDGITQGSGVHMVGQTITLNSNAWHAVSINDNDLNFQDSDTSQKLATPETFNGQTYNSGTVVEAEFRMVLSYGGDSWTVVAFNVNNSSPAYGTVEGLAFIGGPGGFPPVGVPLTVTSAGEGPSFAATSYATPICFASGTMIDTPDGPRLVEEIKVGDLVQTLHDGPQPVLWHASRSWPAQGAYAPVLFRTGAIGNARPLRLSPQHRVRVTDWRAEVFCGEEAVLIPALHFVNGRDVIVETGGILTYHHLLFSRHQIIWSEGVETESFHPGETGVAGLPCQTRAELYSLFPELEFDPATYGAAVHPSVRRHEAQVVLAA